MALYKMTDSGMVRNDVRTFAELGLKEREHLQQVLMKDISVLEEGLLVIAEEYGDFDGANRRIDLLALDQDGSLVVIELKRTTDGGHMELQALRYAAFVSAMTFDDVLRTYTAHRELHGEPGGDPRAELLAHLGYVNEEDNPDIANSVRIILVSADFGHEITTTVLWLNDTFDMRIRCVQLLPHQIAGETFVEIRQLIPLPAAESYQIKIGKKNAERAQKTGVSKKDYTRYCIVVDGVAGASLSKRGSIKAMVDALVDRGIAPSAVQQVLTPYRLLELPGILGTQDDVEAALAASGTKVGKDRWFCAAAYPVPEEGRTFLLSNQWGPDTEGVLEKLRGSFPDTGVDFERADA